ncbi:MAG: EF-P lysine aminoacylase EpmA [Fibrobacterota bacterium]
MPSDRKSFFHKQKHLIFPDKLEIIRDFFREKKVKEVFTPALSSFAPTDPAIQPLRAVSAETTRNETPLFLATSPEFRMKELLCRGSGDIYQICRAFRADEYGPMHSPDFLILEWYRTGFDEHAMMHETEEFIKTVLPEKYSEIFERVKYQDLFLQFSETDPFGPPAHIRECAKDHGLFPVPDSVDTCLDFIMSSVIQPELKKSGRNIFIHDYPPSQAALAEINHDTEPATAARFELLINGVEICNGYRELREPGEYQRRFLNDNIKREEQNMPTVPIDIEFLDTLSEDPLPACSGNALGLDRLILTLDI